MAGAPLRHTGNGRLADSQSCYFRGSSGANQAGPGQLMDQWLYLFSTPKYQQQLEGVWGGSMTRVEANEKTKKLLFFSVTHRQKTIFIMLTAILVVLYGSLSALS